jgi:hypothetical protein
MLCWRVVVSCAAKAGERVLAVYGGGGALWREEEQLYSTSGKLRLNAEETGGKKPGAQLRNNVVVCEAAPLSCKLVTRMQGGSSFTRHRAAYRAAFARDDIVKSNQCK